MIHGNLFTRDYLLEGIARTERCKNLNESVLESKRVRLLEVANEFLRIKNPNEAETEANFIYPVLEILDWSDCQVQQILSTKGRKQVPDALLFADESARDQAVSEAEQWKRFQYGLAVVEAKRWGRALDRADRQSLSEEGVPSTQMLQYLSRVDVQTGGRVKLGILTNGAKWRLYFQGALSVSEDFFELDLAKALELPGHELDLVDLSDPRLTPETALRLFVLMFDKTAFLPCEGQRTFHDVSRETGRVWEEQVATDLSRLVFEELFPKLVDALATHDPDRPEEVDSTYLEQVGQNALVLLYRLLFVVYAEDRDLLPDSQEPYKSYSLTAMRLEVSDGRSRGKTFSSSIATYWPKLMAVFQAIAEGDNSLGIPPYNGGLFAKDRADLVDRVQLPDDIVADLILGLSHRMEDGEFLYINYRDLSVQQLGTIYERTLEYRLRYEDGRIVTVADDAARHESGSYYTPDSLVSLIIEKAVGPFVEEKLRVFRTKVAELAKDTRRIEIRLAELRGYDPVTAILSLKVCDPAMGSGHFLVNLVDWLADRALAAMAEAEALVDWSENAYQSPVAGGIEQTRQDIIEQATKHDWPFVLEHLDDKHIVRRTILKRCIYGVDKNPMAVELAKVALWLHTFTVGAPLSFLDHHLRCGNSLFGFWMREAMDTLSNKWGGQLLINEPMQKAMAQAIAMQKLERVTDVDIAEVHESRALFDGIDQETRPLNIFMNVLYALDWVKLGKEEKAAVRAWLDGQFGDPFDVARGRYVLGPTDGGDGHPLAKDILASIPAKSRADAERFAGILNQARSIMRDERFHNWQVAYPGVWKQWESSQLHGGFDAVIGNPPYVRQELIRSSKPALKSAYPETYSGTADLYVYFFDQGVNLLRAGGRLSYVVTNKWLRAGYAEGLRSLFAEKAWVEFVADFGHAKKFFPDADVFPSVVVVQKPHEVEPPIETDVCVLSRDDVPDKDLEGAVDNATYALPRAHFTRESWILEPPEVLSLVERVSGCGRTLSDFDDVKIFRGVTTGLNDAFLIDSETRERLIQETPEAHELIKPYLPGQDIERWYSRWDKTWMIFTRRGVEISRYPSILRHLELYREKLEPKPANWQPVSDDDRWMGRKSGQYKWYEIQDSTEYWEAFERPKIIYQEIAWSQTFQIDRTGLFLPNTAYLISTTDPWLLCVLNSPLIWWWSWRKAVHGKDEALRFIKEFVLTLPIPHTPPSFAKCGEESIELLEQKSRDISQANTEISDWLKFELGLEKLKKGLRVPTTLDAEEFVVAVRENLPKRQKLTAAEIAELKREHAATIQPARKLCREVLNQERQLSKLVNKAFGLTSEDVQLMWRTAPPRMPFTPAVVQPTKRDASMAGPC